MKRFLILCAVVASGWLIAQTSDGFGPEELAVTAPVVASGGGGTVTFSDDFDRADASPMSLTSSSGGTWETGVGGLENMQIVGNAATGAAGISSAAARVVSPDFPDNHGMTITYGSGNVKGAIVRWSGNDGYLAYYSSPTSVVLYKFGTGAASLTTYTIEAPSSGWLLTLEASGTTLTVKTNGVTMGTYTDSSWSTGQPGMWSGSSDGAILDVSATGL